MMNIFWRRKNSGQTIIELLVALTLIVLFLTGVIVVQLYSVRNVQFSQNKSAATKLAEQQFERARVIRDSPGIDAMDICRFGCFINSMLTPVPITPTGTYGQLLVLENPAADCPDSGGGASADTYKATVVVSWGGNVTPPPDVMLATCLNK